MEPAPGNRVSSRPQPGPDIQVRIPELKLLFNPMDPSALGSKDLHPHVEKFIVSWGGEVPTKEPLTLVIHTDRPASETEVKDATFAIQAFFNQRADATERQLRQLFRVGRVSLVIALVFLALSIAAGELLVSGSEGSNLRRALGETLHIGGWVAMWRPLETFLYDWWPVSADVRLFRRLAAMSVTGVSGEAS